MPDARLSNARYPRTLFERLADDAPGRADERPHARLLGAEELRESVARDLEALLNSRCAYRDEVFKHFPETSKSLASYGMNDFVGLSLANPSDRHFICRSIEQTIANHEQRLRQVRVTLELEKHSINRLKFTIQALLVVHPSAEPVLFDALLQPSTLQYSVSKGKRAPAN
jgi:type VI secretion system protein ImpF